LVRSGELVLLGPGSVALGGRPLRLRQWCDAQFRSWAAAMGADEWHFPAIIPRGVLERAEFFESFAPLATYVGAGHPPHQPAAAPPLLPPAVCSPICPRLGGRTRAADRPLLLTAAGECYRHESEALQPLARQWAFQMREIVVFGTPEQVHDLRRV